MVYRRGRLRERMNGGCRLKYAEGGSVPSMAYQLHRGNSISKSIVAMVALWLGRYVVCPS